MIAKQYKLTLTPSTDKFINIPINFDLDVMGREDDISKYQSKVVQDVVGTSDFEIDRFAHSENILDKKTNLNLDFYFWQTGNTPQYKLSYLTDFTDREIYYYSNSFTNSFFKLDFFDSPEQTTQINYLTQIIPVQQGGFENVTITSFIPNLNTQIRKPSFSLDFVGDKEGFFVYWLRKKEFINLDTFYVSAKFFDAKFGQFIRFVNSNIPQNIKNFNPTKYFYYEYKLDYNTKTYQVFGNGINPRVRRGINGSPINWYEYINPA
jgi:hypothetical protein